MLRRATKQQAHRDLLQIPDFSAKEIDRLFSLAESMRNGKYKKKPLAGKSLAMIFMKSSTRTRVSFEVGAWQLEGYDPNPMILQRDSRKMRLRCPLACA